MARKNKAAASAVVENSTSPATVTETQAPVADVTSTEAPVVTSKGKRLVKRTNVPWRRKYYFLDEAKYAETEEVRKTKASQIQLMLKYMAENGLTDVDHANQGDAICSGAIAKGYVKTKINPPVLFAYYRKDMEQLGLVFAGYNIV